MRSLLLLLSILTLSHNKYTKYCDIKGNITNPGVYVIKENYTIKDIINDAGGLKENSYTDNINLSKKVSDEMVIYINTKQEINKLKKLNTCLCSPKYVYIECENKTEKDNNNIITTTNTIIPKTTTMINFETTKTTSKTIKDITTTKSNLDNINDEIELIDINTCTLEDLIKIKGLGEKKANKIIEYRNHFGRFNTINDIMNISGIGESTFNAIKDYIKV